MTHYSTLGVVPGASPEDIKKAYRKKCRLTHPDVAGPGSAAKFHAVQEAWEVLSDADRKYDYDWSLSGSEPHGQGTNERKPGAPTQGSRDPFFVPTQQQKPRPSMPSTADSEWVKIAKRHRNVFRDSGWWWPLMAGAALVLWIVMTNVVAYLAPASPVPVIMRVQIIAGIIAAIMLSRGGRAKTASAFVIDAVLDRRWVQVTIVLGLIPLALALPSMLDGTMAVRDRWVLASALLLNGGAALFTMTAGARMLRRFNALWRGPWRNKSSVRGWVKIELPADPELVDISTAAAGVRDELSSLASYLTTTVPGCRMLLYPDSFEWGSSGLLIVSGHRVAVVDGFNLQAYSAHAHISRAWEDFQPHVHTSVAHDAEAINTSFKGVEARPFVVALGAVSERAGAKEETVFSAQGFVDALGEWFTQGWGSPGNGQSFRRQRNAFTDRDLLFRLMFGEYPSITG